MKRHMAAEAAEATDGDAAEGEKDFRAAVRPFEHPRFSIDAVKHRRFAARLPNALYCEEIAFSHFGGLPRDAKLGVTA